MSGVCQRSPLAKWLPIAVALSGWSRSSSQWATSIQCTIKSVRIPPPKSQNQRQLRNRYSSNGWSGALPRKSFQATWFGSTLGRPALKPVVPPRFQLRWTLKTSPIRPAFEQLARLLDVRHAALLHADLDDLLVAVLGVDDQRCPRNGRE